MFLPHSYLSALLLLILSMLLWGSWANAQKAERGLPFELFYWDYVWGLLLTVWLAGITLDNLRPYTSENFFRNLAHANSSHLLEALAGGAVFNLGNVLLVAAISLAGMAVAFPVGAGIGLVLGVGLNYAIAPSGNPFLLFGGIVLVLLAIALDARAYAELKHNAGSASRAGVAVSMAAGIAIGLFYPLVARALRGPGHLNPYTVLAIFSAGVLASSFPLLFWFMRHPLQGARVGLEDYRKMPLRQHAWGWLAGALWALGTAANFAASYLPLIGPATAFALGEGNTMISALWGVLVWKEFRGANRRVRILIFFMFVSFAAGLVAIALAPIVH